MRRGDQGGQTITGRVTRPLAPHAAGFRKELASGYLRTRTTTMPFGAGATYLHYGADTDQTATIPPMSQRFLDRRKTAMTNAQDTSEVIDVTRRSPAARSVALAALGW